MRKKRDITFVKIAYLKVDILKRVSFLDLEKYIVTLLKQVYKQYFQRKNTFALFGERIKSSADNLIIFQEIYLICIWSVRENNCSFVVRLLDNKKKTAIIFN